MEFIIPIIPKSSCQIPTGVVYKLTINHTFIYIGSTGDIKTRIQAWQSKLRVGKKLTAKMKPICCLIEIARFDILEIMIPGATENDRLKRENYFLKKEKKNPLLLNTAPTAFSSKGIRFKRKSSAHRV